jgi:hypothetical protein
MEKLLRISFISGAVAIVVHLLLITSIALFLMNFMGFIRLPSSSTYLFFPLIEYTFYVSRIAFFISSLLLTLHKRHFVWKAILLGLLGQMGLTMAIIIPHRYIE